MTLRRRRYRQGYGFKVAKLWVLSHVVANELSRTQLKVPVTDETGLKAKYDFILKFATPEWNGRLLDIPELGISASVYEAMEPLPDLAAALQSQLGLKLQSKKAPVEVLIVDHVEKVPTVN
jgi:uncharacterized protein (TIGR03435 family)